MPHICHLYMFISLKNGRTIFLLVFSVSCDAKTILVSLYCTHLSELPPILFDDDSKIHMQIC